MNTQSNTEPLVDVLRACLTADQEEPDGNLVLVNVVNLLHDINLNLKRIADNLDP